MAGICCSFLRLPISLCKSLCRGCQRISSEYTFFIYTTIFLIFATFGWLFFECPHWKAHPSIHNKKFIMNANTIYGIFVAYAFFAAFTIYHLVHLLVFQMSRVFNTATYHRIHTGGWIIKVLCLIVFILVLYFIPYKPLHFYGLFSVILSFFYLLAQGLSLFCLARLFSSHLLEKYEATYSSFWAILVTSSATLVYIAVIGVHITLYTYFPATYTYVLITISLVLCITICVFRIILSKESLPFTLLEPSMFALYITYLTIKGILLNTDLVPNIDVYNCFYIAVRTMDVAFMVTSLVSCTYIVQQLYKETLEVSTTDVEEQAPSQAKVAEPRAGATAQTSISRRIGSSDPILEQVDQLVLEGNRRPVSQYLVLCLFHIFLTLCSSFYYTVVTDYMRENDNIKEPPARMVEWSYDTARIIACSYVIFIGYSVHAIKTKIQSFRLG
ncbi:probable serine incorporator [Schistocerca gregaria]|uniref:probable serine incorporator n=1 Tax=Schistocerca gregaria TaxID=7010 RepID=UPI00211F241C|nr:probable serine incorporator [Schistocerca gregaria]